MIWTAPFASEYENVKFVIHTQNAELHIFLKSHPGRQCLAIFRPSVVF